MQGCRRQHKGTARGRCLHHGRFIIWKSSFFKHNFIVSKGGQFLYLLCHILLQMAVKYLF